MANYDTYYMGTGGLVVSKSEVETERAAREKQQVLELMLMVKDLNFLEYQKNEAIKKLPKPLVPGGTVDLLALQNVGKNTIAAYAKGMVIALQKLQSKEINLSGTNDGGGSYSTAQDVADLGNSAQVLADVKQFLEAMQRMEKTFNNAAAKGWINATAWNNIRSHFFVKNGRGSQGPEQEVFLAMHRILKGQSLNANEDMARVFNAIRGDLGNNLGKLMEDLIRYMAESPEVESQIKSQVADYLVQSVKGSKGLGSGGAQAGTIRATLVGAKYEKDPTRKKLPITGNRLRDTELTVTTGPNGGKITWGVSAKQYNFHSKKNPRGEIKIAELSFANFADVFARIRRSEMEQRKTSRGNNALYGYRLLGENHEKNSPILLYLLSHRVAEVAFGSSIGQMTGNDTAELMVINGRMKNTADVLKMGTFNVSTSKFPENIGGEWWHPDNALDNVHAIHKAKLVAQLEFGQQRAIQAFG